MWLTATAVLFAMMWPGPNPATANGSSPSRGAVESSLDLPFVPQQKNLCGGACLAMVMRYYGAPSLRARDFAPCIDASGGISANRMIRAARARGYDAGASFGDSTALCRALRQRRPVIVLVDGSARLLHYLVIIAATRDQVVFHDPARRPAMSQTMRAFEKRWSASGGWMLVLSPRDDAVPENPPVVEVAASQDTTGADSIRAESRLFTERALRAFREERWPQSRDAAQTAVALDPHRARAWHVLGAAHYMLNEHDAALSAWNHTGAPTLDLVRVQGLERTRYGVISAAMNVDDDALLTPSSLLMARRRLELIPALSASRLDYRPVGTARADLDIAVRERSVWPFSATQLGVFGVRALTERTLHASLCSPSGGGEVVAASYRWWENRPRAELALTTPELFGWQGMTRLAFADEVQTYANDSGGASAANIVETMREGTIDRRQWLAPAWMFDAGAGFHHVRERGNYASFGSALTWLTAQDRLALRAGACVWDRIDDGEALHARLDVSADQRATFSSVIELAARAGWGVVDAAAPRSLWPGAGTGPGRPELLRAHPLLLDDGIINGDAFASSLFTAGIEATRWMFAGILGAAVFVDGAAPTSMHDLIVDAGAGLRVRPPGEHGYVRIDIATGLSQSTHAFSVAWQPFDH